jgi:Transposase DDE domain
VVATPVPGIEAGTTIQAREVLERAQQIARQIDPNAPSVVVSPLRRSAVGRGRSRPFDDLALPPGVGGILTSADLHDSQPAAHLIRGDEHAVYGDKAYASQGLRDRLADAGINDGLMYKAARNKPLKPWQSWFNKAVAAIRAAVERRFGIMKRGYGFRRVR